MNINCDNSRQLNPSPQNWKRAGADKLQPQDVEEVCENDDAEMSESNNSGNSESRVYDDVITERTNIVWR